MSALRRPQSAYLAAAHIAGWPAQHKRTGLSTAFCSRRVTRESGASELESRDDRSGGRGRHASGSPGSVPWKTGRPPLSSNARPPLAKVREYCSVAEVRVRKAAGNEHL